MNLRPSLRIDPSRIKERIRLPLEIHILSYLKDHSFEGKNIFPAVEILQRLAGSLQSYHPDAFIRSMHHASFDRLLLVEGEDRINDVYNELEIYENGRISSKFVTEGPIKGTKITRTKVHAVVDFVTEEKHDSELPMDMVSALEGICCRIPSRRLYEELVPFGPSYQNVKGEICLSESGGIAQVYGAFLPAPSEPLGSPFPLDGAFHVACAWGQRFHHIVAFPVGFEERIVVNPTMPGETYRCIILPVSVAGGALKFDIWIHDLAGELRENIRGLIMRDIFNGRIKPPMWVQSDGTFPLAEIKRHCRAAVVIDHDTITDFAVKALSGDENERIRNMGKRRQKSYLVARLALKFLSRKLSGNDRATPASDIHTMMADRIHPRCPILGGRDTAFCSVSHDRRYVIAVAGNEEIGADVEAISDRILKIRHGYMGKEELALTEASPLGIVEASIRVWSIKEGVSKATDMPLEKAWKQVSVDDVGRAKSRLNVEGIRYAAYHDTADGHIFTLVKREA
jgi:phosphopantetheinyl transferase